MSEPSSACVPRTLEPELMDSAEEAALYDAMDHGEVNTRFTLDFLEFWNRYEPGTSGAATVIDLGSGTARIPILICSEMPEIRIVAVDAALHMQKVARKNITDANLSDRISLSTCDVKTLVDFADESIDGVISNTLLHHLADPSRLLEQALRVLRPNGLLFLRDLMRPSTANDIDRLTDLHAAGEPDDSRQLLHQSLHAALTIHEIRDCITQLGMPADAVQATSDRHWTLAFQRQQ